MKKLFLIAIAFHSAVTGLLAQNKPMLRITVEREQKTQRDIKKKGGEEWRGDYIYYTPQVVDLSKSVVLDIKIQNMGAADAKGLVVKYAVFGKDRQTRDLKVATQGQKQIDLKALQAQTIQTEPVQFESQDVKYTHGEFGHLNKQSGDKYYGVGVSVLLGQQKLASFFEPSSLDKEAEKLDLGL